MKKNALTFLIGLVSILNIGLLPSCKKIDPAPKKTTTDTLKVGLTDSLKVGLIAYYTFNNTGADSSGRGNDGTVYSIYSTTDRFGKANSAYYFDGINSYITVKDNHDLRLANTDFTINAWVKLDALKGGVISAKRVPGTANSGWTWSVGNDQVFYGPGGGSTNAFGYTEINTGQWYMVTNIYSAVKQQLTIYVNGVLVSTTNGILTPNASTNAPLYIGRDNPSIYSPGYFFQGAMDDFRIYNRTLSISEIQKLYIAPDPLTTDIVAYWPLNGNANDLSGNGHNGTTYNVTPVADRFGKANNAYHFNGSTSYISVPDTATLRLYNTNFTLNAWVKLDTLNGGLILAKRVPGTANSGWTWSFGNGQVFYGPGGGSTNAFGYIAINTGQWYMVTIVYNNARQQLTMYVNGVLVNTTNSILTPNASINALLYIGRDDPSIYSPGYFFRGSIDEIKIYSSALSANSIKRLFNASN